MSEEEKELKNRKDLIDYVIKLNDRNLQERRESGFTLYIVFFAFFAILFSLLENDNLSMITQPNHLNFVIISITMNLTFVISVLMYLYEQIVKRESPIKPSEIDNEIKVRSIFPQFLIYSSYLLINIFFIIKEDGNYDGSQFLSSIIFYSFLIVMLVLGLLSQNKPNGNLRKKLIIISLIVLLPPVFITCYNAYIFQTPTNYQFSSPIKVGLLLSGILIVFTKLIDIHEESKKFKWLRQFEMKVTLDENINFEDLKSELKLKYLGEDY